MKKTFIVKPEFEGKRLDLFLAFNLPNLSRSQVKKIITANNTHVNERVEYKANYKVREGDHISISYDHVPDPLSEIKAENIPLDVVFDDEGLVAINKPEGMVVHPATGNYSGTLINALIYKFRELRNVGEIHRAGLINRIDKDTSGIVLVGKTNESLWFYSKQFAQRQVNKEYLAIVRGDFSQFLGSKRSITISNYIARNPVHRKKYSVVGNGKGRIAKTKISLVAMSKEKEYSLLSVKPITGRTHQIRVHLSNIDFPIVGDVVYSGEKCERLLLHSYKTKLMLLSAKMKTIKAPLSGTFLDFLTTHFYKKDIKKYV